MHVFSLQTEEVGDGYELIKTTCSDLRKKKVKLLIARKRTSRISRKDITANAILELK